MLHTDVYFVVQLGTDKAFQANLTIKFDKVKQNVGGGYIDNTNSTDYGKFIAPMNGTYQFIVTIMNENQDVYGNLMINGVLESESYAGVVTLQMGMATAVIYLKTGDQVWIKNSQSDSGGMYRAGYTSFSGHMIRADL